MNKNPKDSQTDDMVWELESQLEPGMLRFLAHVIENGLQAGLRTQQDFIRHFTPKDIMQGLAERPDLRANILVPTTGVRPKIALKKTAESAGLDLQISLDEGETDAELIVSLFHPDDRVRYLDTARLWNYIIEPKFWTTEAKDGNAHTQAKAHMAFIVARAIEDHLVTHRDVVDGISVGTMVKYLPPTELQSMIEKALSNSHSGTPFTEQNLLEAVPATKMMEHIPLSLVWNQVVCPKIAEKKDLANQGSAVNSSANSNSGRGSNNGNSNNISSSNGSSNNATSSNASSNNSQKHNEDLSSNPSELEGKIAA